MKLLSLLVLTVLVASAVCSFRDMDPTARYLKELEMELELENNLKSLSRARRVPGAADGRSCGKKLVIFVFSICGEICAAKDGLDLATYCCSNQCTDDYIKTTCCPNA